MGNIIANLGEAAFQAEELARRNKMEAFAAEEALGVLDRSQAIRVSGNNDPALDNIEARMHTLIRRVRASQQRPETQFGTLNQFRIGGRSICTSACVEFILGSTIDESIYRGAERYSRIPRHGRGEHRAFNEVLRGEEFVFFTGVNGNHWDDLFRSIADTERVAVGITVGPESFALIKLADEYIIFDPHGRGHLNRGNTNAFTRRFNTRDAAKAFLMQIAPITEDNIMFPGYGQIDVTRYDKTGQIDVIYEGAGRLTLRGSVGVLNWSDDRLVQRIDGVRSFTFFGRIGQGEFKILRDGEWEEGQNHILAPRQFVRLTFPREGAFRHSAEQVNNIT